MTYQLIFSKEADYDLNKIKVWFDQINVQLTEDLFHFIGSELNRIKKDPFIYQVRYREIRIAFVNRFGYGIHFLIKGRKIIVLRVLHTKQYFDERK